MTIVGNVVYRRVVRKNVFFAVANWEQVIEADVCPIVGTVSFSIVVFVLVVSTRYLDGVHRVLEGVYLHTCIS